MGAFSESVTLIFEPVKDRDDAGNPITIESETTVLCNELSVYGSEFYNAGQVGLKPELVLEVHAFEYSGQKKVKYKGKEYEVLRTYKPGDLIQLTIGGKIGT